MTDIQAFEEAQKAILQLKIAIVRTLQGHPDGLSTTEIARKLGINQGYNDGHTGEIPRTLLERLQQEGIVVRDGEKNWRLAA